MKGMVDISYWWIWFIAILCSIIISRGNKYYFEIIKRKREGRKRKMPTELMKEFIGKICAITLFNESFGITGKIVSIEGNWIKVSEKDTSRLVNGDMITNIKILPEKYQK